MATNLDIYANISAVDGDRLANPGNYVLMDLANDKLIFSAGSAAVADGADTPSNAELNEASTIIGATDIEVAKTFLLDVSDVGLELKEIQLAGSTDTQYVFNLSFDNATASEPTLEAWDDNVHTTTNLHVLGAGTPSNSMIRAVLTTAGTPGPSWVGVPIGGSSNTLLLNGGAGLLSAASELYFNLKIVIPGGYATPYVETPVITVRYTFN